MTIDSLSDVLSVFISLFFGAVISLIYDIFKSYRIAFKSSNIFIIVQDIIFSIISAILTYLLLYICVKGEIRWFVLIFEIIGFIIFRIFLSKLIVKSIVNINLFIKKNIIAHLKCGTFFIENKINQFFDNFFNKISKKSLKHKQ